MTRVPTPRKMTSNIDLSHPSATLLLVGNFAPDEGFAWWLMENFWIELSYLARARGLEPLLIYRDVGTIPESIRSAQIPTAFRPFLVGESTLARDLELVRERRVRFVYLTDRPFWDPRYALLRGAGVRRIVTHDHVPGDRPDVGGARALLKGILNRLPLVCADLQLAVSPFVKERAQRTGRIPAHRVEVVQNGIQPIQCQEFDPHYVHRVFGVPQDHTVCVVVGRAHRYKRIDFLIQVAARLRRLPGGTQITFLFCGDGPDLEWLQGLAEDAELEDRLVFAGRRDDIPAILCSSDMAFHPSQGEAFSLAIVEYMSAGLPVLVPSLPSVRQAIEHGRTGFVYPDGDVETAAHFVLKLHGDAELRRNLGVEASHIAATRYNLDQMNETFREVMARTLAEVF